MENEIKKENHDDKTEAKAEEKVIDEKQEKQKKLNVEGLSDKEAKKMLKDILKVHEEVNEELLKAENALKKAADEAAKNKDSWYRTAAEFENFKRRNEGVRKQAYDDGKKDAISGILAIGDSVDRALTMVTEEKTLEGVKLIARSFKEALGALGVEQIDPLGENFDPETAEAIATVPAEENEEAGLIKTVYKKGYRMSGKMIRYAQVVVTAK